MARYLLITSAIDKTPFAVWIEANGELAAHFGNPSKNKREEDLAKEFQQTRLEDLTTDRSTYYSSSIGDFIGPAKREIQDIIDELNRPEPKSPKIGPRFKKSHIKFGLNIKALRRGFRRILIVEPYDPDAKDGDGDGIVQEGTAWERPAGTRILDANGQEIKAGATSQYRKRSHRIVDADNKPVDYVPGYERSESGSIGERLGTVGRAVPGEQGDGGLDVEDQPGRSISAPGYLLEPVKRQFEDTELGRLVDRVMYYVRERLKEMGPVRVSLAIRRMGEDPENWFPDPTRNDLTPEEESRVLELRAKIMEEAEDLLQEIYETRQVHVAVPVDALIGEGGNTGIVGNGEIRSQFETSRSQGYLDTGWREEYESTHLGFPHDPNEENPVERFIIYGYMPIQRDQEGRLAPELDRAAIYGNTHVRMRPGVSDRTTVTFGDSLDNQSWPIPLDPDLRDAHRQELDSYFADAGSRYESDEHMLFGAGQPSLGAWESGIIGKIIGDRLIDDFLTDELTGSDSLSDVWTPGRGDWLPKRVGGYIEAQIHGGVEWGDIEEITLPAAIPVVVGSQTEYIDTRDFLASNDPRAKKLLELAKQHGVTISIYNHKNGEDSYIPIDGFLEETTISGGPPSTVYMGPRRNPVVPRDPEIRSAHIGSTPDPVPSPTTDAFDSAPAVNAEATDRQDLVEPVRPRAPYTPSPPPFSGRAAELADQAGGSFSAMLELLEEEGYWVIDFETTGFDHGNMPTQVAMIQVGRDGRVIRRVNRFINPNRPLSDWSRQHLRDGDGNPLTEEWLAANGMSMNDAQEMISELLNGQIVVAHNAPFDLEVLNRIVDEHGGSLNLGGTVDTLALMRMAVPKGGDDAAGPTSHGLGSLSAYLGYTLGEGAHDALEDVIATSEVLRRGLASADDNPRAEPEVLDNNYMRMDYERQVREHAVAMAKHRDAMREYNTQLHEYQRALAQSKDVALPNVRVPYQPGGSDPDDVITRAEDGRFEAKRKMKEGLIDLLSDVGEGAEGEAEWERFAGALSKAIPGVTPEFDPSTLGMPKRERRRQWVDGIIGKLLESDDEFIDEIIGNGIGEVGETELAKQVYVALTADSAAEALTDGRIKTSFERPPVDGDLSFVERAQVESRKFGVPGGTADRDRPVYGFIPRSVHYGFAGQRDLDPDPTLDGGMLYGSVAVRLKDDVRGRTTATFGDSAGDEAGIAIPLTDAARETLLSGLPDPKTGNRTTVRKALMGGAVSTRFSDEVASITARAWIDRLPDDLREIVMRRIRERERRAIVSKPDAKYVETQIHGGVTLDDIAEIVIPDTMDVESEQAIRLFEAAAERGVRIRTPKGKVVALLPNGKWGLSGLEQVSGEKTANVQGLATKAARNLTRLIDEPYDENPRDGDNDGIVQEWTVWERPAGTTLRMPDGKPIQAGARIQSTALTARPEGMQVIDRDGNPVDYKPTYLPRVEAGTIGAEVGRVKPDYSPPLPPKSASTAPGKKPSKRGTALSDVGANSVGERGSATIRQIFAPKPTPPASAPTPEAPAPPQRPRLPEVPERKTIRDQYIPGMPTPLIEWMRDHPSDALAQWNEADTRSARYPIGLMAKLIATGFDWDVDGDEVILGELGGLIADTPAFREEYRRALFHPDGKRRDFDDTEDEVEALITRLMGEALDDDILDSVATVRAAEVDRLSQSTPRIAMTEDVLMRVLKSGRILSQFETDTSGGTYGPEYRQQVEERIANVPYELDPHLRPIYGFLPDTNIDYQWQDNGELLGIEARRQPDAMASVYGDFHVVLKPEVRDRSTFTVGDTFINRGLAYPMNPETLEMAARELGVSVEQAKQMLATWALNESGISAVNDLALDEVLSRQSPKIESRLRALLARVKAPGGVTRPATHSYDYQYIDAQIHGGVDLDDVDRVVLPYWTAEDVPEALRSLLEERGIPWELSPKERYHIRNMPKPD